MMILSPVYYDLCSCIPTLHFSSSDEVDALIAEGAEGEEEEGPEEDSAEPANTSG